MFRLPNIFAGFFGAGDGPGRLDINGLDSGSSGSGEHFGLPQNEWAEVGNLSAGLPWDLKFGILNAGDVSNAKGDLVAMDAQVSMQKEYFSLQEKMLDRWKEIQQIQAELAKITMEGRLSVAQLDAKTAERYYGHIARMNILQQETSNAQSLALEQQNYGILLANHKLGNNKKLLGDEFREESRFNDGQYEQKRQGLADRFRQKLEAVNNPRSKPASDYQPTTGRTLQFGRRRA